MNDSFTASRSYYYDKLTWCVQVKQPIAAYKSLAKHICKDVSVWILYTFMCFSVVFMGYFMQQFEDLQPKWDWFRITFAGIAPCLGFVSEYKPKIISHRIFFICCVFGAMLSYIVTNSIVLLLITHPFYENQIKSIQEIIDGDFKLVGDGFALQHLMQQKQVNCLF